MLAGAGMSKPITCERCEASERAAALGSAQAALVLGSTYDPGRLWSLGVFGMVGNKERAAHWYQRADELGHPEAKDRLKSLRN